MFEKNQVTYDLCFDVLGADGAQPLVDVDVPLGYHLQTRSRLPIIEIQYGGRRLNRRTALL